MANELVADVASATPLATILARELFARDLSKASRCRPRPRRVVLHMCFRDRRHSQPRGSHRSPREPVARPQPVASVRRTQPQLSRVISSNWPSRTGLACGPGGWARVTVLPNDWAAVYFGGTSDIFSSRVWVVGGRSARGRNGLRRRSGLARRLRFSRRKRL